MGRIQVGSMWWEALYSTGSDTRDGVRQTHDQHNHPRIRPSGKSACVTETRLGTHRLDPTQSDGCILQAAGTAAAVKAF
jgi:hypothetical protein